MGDKLLYCRFCAKNKPSLDLIDLAIDVIKKCEVIEKLSIAVNYVDFSDKSLPETICGSCYDTLNVSHEFFINVKRSQTILCGIISNDFVEYSDEDVSGPEARAIAEIKNELQKSEEFRRSEIKLENNSDNEAVDCTDFNQGTSDDEATKPHSNQTVYVHQNIQGENSIDIKSDKSLRKMKDCNSHSNFKTVHMELEYVDVLVFKHVAKKKNALQELSHSWKSYKWCCCHCREWFDTMAEVRTHSKETHNICYGFKCVDCDEEFNMFNAFIEHVRQHKEFLRYYCQYCNMRFESTSQCLQHISSHWEGMQKICSFCGEILPDQAALERHKDMYKKLSKKLMKRKSPAVVNISNVSEIVVKSWDDYQWSCQECCQRLPNVAALRRHTQELHNKCFAMKCMDCLTVMLNVRMFVAHVTKHRPYLKKYCHLCNLHVEDIFSMVNHIKDHMSGPQRPCDGCGQLFENNELLMKHMKEFDAPRPKGSLTTDDVTCDICNKDCHTLARLRMHRKVHNTNRERHYVCDTCGKAFLNEHALKGHKKVHKAKTEICNICKKAFYFKKNLKEHLTTHSDSKPLKCDECGKGFRSKSRLKYHLAIHSDVKAYRCPECGKNFRHHNTLRVHLKQHTGIRPYSCKVCARTFTNWGNCDKHMIRKHNMTLSKTKKIPQSLVVSENQGGV